MKKLYSNLLPASYQYQRKTNQPSISLIGNHVTKILLLFFLQAIFLPHTGWSQNSLNSGDFSTGSWGVGQAMGASAGSSLIITKAVSSAGDKYFRFYGDGSPCGEYQANTNGDFFTANTVVTAPNGNCGSSNAWRINVPTATSNVVFKTDGGNDGMDATVAFVVQGAIQTVSTVTRTPSGTVYPGQDVTITATLSADFNTGQAAYLRYTNNGFSTSTVVQMTGTGTTRTATIPGTANLPSTAVTYYVFTSGDTGPASNGSDADLFTINLNNNGGSNYTYTPAAGWTTAAVGNWNAVGKWVGGGTPPIGANMGLVTIAHATTLNQDALVGSVAINTGITLTLSAGQTLEINSGGSITRAGTGAISANATSTVRFLGNGSIGWLNTWGNLETAGALTVTGVQTITTNFQINTGGSISAAPTYGASSTLVYNSGGSYNINNEWTATIDGTAGSGRPQNVTIQNGTTLNMPATTRALAGNFTITSGTLAMTATGDLILRGNWSNSGTYTPNNSSIFFMGATASTVFKSGGETFDNLVILKSAGVNIQLLSNLTIAGSKSNPFIFSNSVTGGGIDLNGNDLTLASVASGIALGSGTGLVRNISGTGNLYITGGTKTVNRVTTNTLVIGSGVNVQLSTGLDCGFIAGPSSMTTLNGTLTINSGGFVSTYAPIYGSSSTLVYNSGGIYNVNAEWQATADGAAGYGRPQNVTIQNSTTVNLPINFKAMAGNLTIGSGCTFNLNASAGDFSLRGNWVNNGGTFNHNNRYVVFRGTTGTTTVEKVGGTETFYQLLIDKGAGAFNLQLNSHVIVTASTGPLSLFGTVTNGSGINLNGFDLTLSGGGGTIDLGAGTALVKNITGSGNLYISGNKTITRTTSNTITFGPSVNVQVSAGLTLNAASIATVNGTLQLNTGGTIISNAPVYGSTSTLIYNQTGAISVGTEWTSAATTAPPVVGRPANVTIQNSTDLSMTTTDRSLFRDLDISSGSLSLNGTSGNLLVGGNWTRAATGAAFNQNGRTVQFWAVTPSFLPTTISRTGGETFGAVTIAKTVGINVNLGCDVTINGLLTMSSGRISIGSNTLEILGNNSGTVATISGTSASTLTIGGTGTLTAALGFTAGAQQLGTLNINRSTTGIVTLGSNLLIDNGSGLNNSQLNLLNGVLTVATGFTLTVANTNISGSASSFVHTAQPAGRMAFVVSGAGVNNLNFPIGSSTTAYRPLVFANVDQSATNTYSVASWALPGSTASATENAPLVGTSSVRYYPLTISTLANLNTLGTVSLLLGVDEAPSLDVLSIAQVVSGAWEDVGITLGGSVRTSTDLSLDISSATTAFAFGLTAFPVIFVGTGGNDANSGESAALRKLTVPAAISAAINGGTIQTTSAISMAASGYTIDKNININTTGFTLTIPANANPTVTAKSVHPFVPANVNTGTDAITVTGHQLATGMPVTFENYGDAVGFMPSGINTGTDVLTIGANIATGQPVIYQAYEGTAAGGLTHGTTYFAINVSATQIQLAASYADAIANSPVVDITSTGTALSHSVISSVPQGLVQSTLYYVIVLDANTIQLAASNADALTGTAIDLLTTGGGNHVVYFTPTYTGTISSSATILNINEPQAHIKGFFSLISAATMTANLVAGTYSMQPTILVNRTTTTSIIGAGIGTTILDGKGKISSATNYYGFNFNTAAAVPTVTISNLKVTGYYNGINRNSANTSTTINIDNVDASDNYSRGANFEGAGAITTLNIRNGIYSNNNGVGVSSYGINVTGMTRTTTNIRNNTVSGNRNSGIEIGAGTTSVMLVRGNTISGVASVSPLHNSVTEYGIAVNANAGVAGSGSGISNNQIQMLGRAGIECRGCIGNGAVSGAASFRVASNYITQAGGPYTIDPASSLVNETQDIAGIAVGNLQSGTNPSLVVVDSNHVSAVQQPNSATTAFTAFGIVVSGTSILVRGNLVESCEIGIQAQQGAPGNESNTPDDYYSRDNTPTSTNFLANRNSLTSNTVFAARNQGLTGTINFMGNWWGDENGPTHASNTNSGLTGFGAGAGQPVPAGTGIAYNAHLAEDPDEDAGTPLLQITKGLKFRLKPTANSIQLSGAGTLYVINQGLSVCQSLSPTTGLTDTLDLAPITWTLPGQSLLIRRRMHLRGNFGSGTKPVINGTGSSVHPQEQTPNARMLINMAAQNSGIENLDIRFSVPAFVFGVSNLMGIADTVLSVASVITGMVIKNNIIQNTGSYNFTSYGLYIKSLNYSSDPSIVTVTGNQIGSPGASFGAPIRIWSCRGNFTNNTLTGLYAFRWGTPIVGTGTWEIANNTFNGSMELNSQQASSTLNVHDNIFNRNSAVGHPQGIEVRLNRLPTAFCNIYNNTFNNIGQGGYPYWGILSLRCQNVSITDNIFNAHSAATDFQFIHASTRQQGTLANPSDNFLNTISIKGNQFNGNASAGTNKVGINFARHRSEQTFGTIEIGGPNPADTNTFTGLSRFVECDPYTGNFSGVGLPYSGLTGTPDATCVPMDVDFDISQNKFEVSGGTKAPHTMSKTELLELEDKVQHAVDYGSLGFVTVKPMNAYVTPASFLTGYTATPLIARALNKASDGWTITTKTATYNETVTIDKTLTFANNGNTVLQDLTMNGTGKTLTLADDFDVSNGGTLTLTDGIIETGANILTVLNPAAAAATGYSSASHVKGNLKRAINTGTLYVYPVGNGTDIQELSMTFNTVSSLTDVTVSFTNTAPGTNVTSFNEAGAQYDDILQTGYWIVEPNVGGNATNYSMRLKPVNFTNFPSGGGFSYYGILKRVGAGNWEIQGIYDNPMTPNRVFGDGTIRRNNLSGFSNFGVGAATDVPLPVQLSDFTARRLGEDVELEWKTLSEQGFSHFDIQRSTDGIVFETIASISGKSDNGAEYRYMDLSPFKGVDRLFYRLNLFDLSLHQTKSPVRVVRDKTPVLTLETYPNPVENTLWFSAPKTGNLKMYDAMGRLVLDQANTQLQLLDVSQLSQGVYTLILDTGDKIEKTRFVKH